MKLFSFILSLWLLLIFSENGVGQTLNFDIGGRTGHAERSYISIFGNSGSQSSAGTVSGTVGGESFNATFTLSVNSSDSVPVLEYRGSATANNFIGVASSQDGQLMNSDFDDQVTLVFTSVDNVRIQFDGFTKVSAGNIGSDERMMVNGVSSGNITGGGSVDLTAAPFSNLPQSLTLTASMATGGGGSSLDLAEIGLRFSVIPVNPDSTPPSSPTGLNITEGNGQLSVQWSANTEDDFSHYEVLRRSAASEYQLIGTQNSNQITEVGLHNGFRYYYRIVAYDTSGNASAPSDPVEGIPFVPGIVGQTYLSGIFYEDYIGFSHQTSLLSDRVANQDNDTHADLLEYNFGSDHLDSQSKTEITVHAGGSGGSEFLVNYYERISSPSAHARLEYSTDLSMWNSLHLEELSRTVQTDGRTELVVVRLNDPALVNEEQIFVRIEVSHNLYLSRFAVVPEATTPTTVSMTAGEADLDPRAVEYFFDAVSSGGNDSGWQRSRLYTDTGLQSGQTYTYRVRVRRVDVSTGLPIENSETDYSRSVSVVTPSSGKRPNIIVFMADDVGFECFDIYGNSDHNTPKISQMAAEGMKFTNFHSQPLCTPSRVQILSGQYNQRSITTFGDYEPNKTFASFFKQAGYETCIAGKWQLDYRNGGINESTDIVLPQRPHQLGFDEYLLWNINGKNIGSRYWSPKLYTTTPVGSPFNIVQGTSSQYGPDLVNEFINDFATGAGNENEPFLIYCPLIDPHSPFITPPGYSGLGTNKAKHQAMVEYMDRKVGVTLDLIRNTPTLKDNTLVIFTSDNGTNKAITTSFNGLPYQGGKSESFDPGTHVAFVAWGLPSIPAGSVCDDLADLTDVLATITDVAGIPIPQDYITDGRSLRSQLYGKSRDPRRWVYGYYYDSRNPNTRRSAWVRNKHFKLYQSGVDHTNSSFVGGNAGKFYDVINDIRETTPLPIPEAGSRMEALKAEFQAVLDRLNEDSQPGNNS